MFGEVLGILFILWLSWNVFLSDVIDEVIKMRHKHKANYAKESKDG